jgi:hypothetical protein
VTFGIGFYETDEDNIPVRYLPPERQCLITTNLLDYEPKHDVTFYSPSHKWQAKSLNGHTLAGENIVRLIYLDESDSHDRADPFYCVAGVVVHADHQWKKLAGELAQVATDWLPPEVAYRFVFHATDMFHGSKYWDRDVWPEEVRHAIMRDLVSIVVRNGLPVVMSISKKPNFANGVAPTAHLTPEKKKILIHAVTAAQCIAWADKWVCDYCPAHEVAMVIAEDKDKVKRLLKTGITVMADTKLLAGWSDDQEAAVSAVGHLPLTRIVDTVNFQGKSDAPLLQLADLCAFVLRRGFADKFVPLEIYNPLAKLVKLARGKSD